MSINYFTKKLFLLILFQLLNASNDSVFAQDTSINTNEIYDLLIDEFVLFINTTTDSSISKKNLTVSKKISDVRTSIIHTNHKLTDIMSDSTIYTDGKIDRNKMRRKYQSAKKKVITYDRYYYDNQVDTFSNCPLNIDYNSKIELEFSHIYNQDSLYHGFVYLRGLEINRKNSNLYYFEITNENNKNKIDFFHKKKVVSDWENSF